MAKFVLLFALLALAGISSAVARHRRHHALVVRGRVYCDPCRAGFETSASTFIAEVRYVEFFNRGYYGTLLYHGKGADLVLAHIDLPHENVVNKAAIKARVILTRYNGIATDERFVNNMGFMTNQPLAGCTQILQQYQELDD
ncbi:hypothetical protein SAY86_022474 [Trapa natans]|uniref:Uncharacterized protein n=1 Tax=Trapa natans TaxID=22666 RepID=A0AAN7LUE4_TRANT|nr:hypothetical protein SAY86_022474 [Trapa natans]